MKKEVEYNKASETALFLYKYFYITQEEYDKIIRRIDKLAYKAGLITANERRVL